MNLMKRAKDILLHRIGSPTELIEPQKLKWDDAQKYEFSSAVEFMHGDFFKTVLGTINDEANKVSRGYIDELMFKEFFGADKRLWIDFVEHITDKTVMEIGSCVATLLSTWDVAACRYVIDPLYCRIVEYQNSNFGCNAFINVVGYSIPAEELVEDLICKIDGALLIRNCLDHSPNWPFILSNASDYMASGAYLLLWNDLMHGPGYEAGHYDITNDIGKFKRLVTNLKFNLVLEYSSPSNPNLNWGCLARKA